MLSQSDFQMKRETAIINRRLPFHLLYGFSQLSEAKQRTTRYAGAY